MDTREVDVVVIGAGAVGENVADRTVQGGLSTVLVEEELVGGECSYWACMPSKALLRAGAAVRAARAVAGAAEAVTGEVDARAVFRRRDRITHGRDDASQVEWLDGAGIELVRGHAELSGPRRVTVTASDGTVTELTARHAVAVCTGSVPVLPDVPGLAEHARGLKSTAEALYLRDHVLQQLELAEVDDDPGRAAARRTIVVVGASYSGTELAVQLRALADSAARQMGFDPAAVRFVLLDLAEQVMPEVGERLGAAAMKVLKARGIEIRLGVTLTEVYSEHVVLSDDSLIRTHTVAWVTGVTGAPLIEKLGLATERGRFKVTTELQVPGHPDVFGAGDAAAVPDVTQPGQLTPPTAQHATRQGKLLAHNVAASLGYGRMKSYKHRNMGLVVDLGPRKAVANPLNIRLSGYPAKFVTRAYHLYAIPRFVNRWAVTLAYLTDMFFDRSVVSFGLSSAEDARFAASEGIPVPKTD